MKSGRARTVAIGSLVFGILLISGMATAQGLYGSNVVATQSNAVTVSSSGTASVNITESTGVSATISGLTGVSSAVVTTQSLNAPSTGVTTMAAGSVYFDISVSLPAGTTAPPGATVTVCETNPSVTSGSTLQYWSGSAWVTASSITVSGTRICGTVPLSALTGTNFVIAPPPANNMILYILVAVAVIVIIGVAIWALRRPRKSL